MTSRIIFEAETLVSFQETIDYYDEISSDLTDRFITDFWETIELIRNNPLHFQIRYKSIRVAFTKIFSFGIHFIFENDSIYVIDLFHTRQDF